MLKQKIFNSYLEKVTGDIRLLQQQLSDLKEAGTNETKSTAGDKYETSLAMLQIEQANVRSHLKNVLDKKAVLEKTDLLLPTCIIGKGSLVKTNRGYFFICAALGKILVDGITVVAISPQSPLGAALTGLRLGGIILVQNNQYLVEDIT